MVRRSFFIHLLDVTIAIGSIFTISSDASAQTTNPELNQLLQETQQIIDETQDYIDQAEAQLQQQEVALKYGCHTMGNAQACTELQDFYRRRSRGHDAGIQYYQQLQENGWADSFGY